MIDFGRLLGSRKTWQRVSLPPEPPVPPFVIILFQPLRPALQRPLPAETFAPFAAVTQRVDEPVSFAPGVLDPDRFHDLGRRRLHGRGIVVGNRGQRFPDPLFDAGDVGIDGGEMVSLGVRS